jgi:type II secretory pathway pseudopilin PulG
MNIRKNDGISLIVLVITIIVIIILAGAVILSLANNNPISQANKATFLSDVSNFK